MDNSRFVIQKTTLDAIGNSIRAKTGKTAIIPLTDMPAEIGSITTGDGVTYSVEIIDDILYITSGANADGGIVPSGTITINRNGEHDVTAYAKADVKVPVSTGSIDIISNGEHDVTAYAKANVNVPIPDGYFKPTGTKTITANGEYTIAAYSKVNVDIDINGTTPAMPIYDTYKLQSTLNFSAIPSEWYGWNHYVYCMIGGEAYISFRIENGTVYATKYSTLEPVKLYDAGGWKSETYRTINFQNLIDKTAITTLLYDWIVSNIEGASGGGGGDSGGDDPVEEYAEIGYELNDDGNSYGVMSASDAEIAVISATHNGLPVTRIYRGALSAMDNVTTVIIPASITSIEDHAFSYSAALDTIRFEGTTAQWNAITFGGSNWNAGVPAKEVVCSNGTISLT